MKKVFTLISFVAMLAMGVGLRAQEITITLLPGWTWISYPLAEAMDITAAFGDFTPMEGDVIKSQFGFSVYENGQWSGNFYEFSPGLGYHYRSNRDYAVTISFGEAFSPFTVETASPTEVTTISAVVGGTVTVPEGSHVFLCGVCWGTEPNPDIDGAHTFEGTGMGQFTTTLDSLTLNTTYYVRAYAVTDYGLAYGENLSFTTHGNFPEGAINGKFTINADGDQVYFSQGNLQYIGSAAEPYWKFAENQWDYLGVTTGQNSNAQDVDRDLFGWGTSGWNTGNTCYQPWDTYNSFGSSYGPKGANNLTGAYANADWGVYNPISNGGNQAGMWRIMTKDEWCYVFNTRTTDSGIRFAKANVNDINGIILLPDDWSASYYGLSDTNSDTTSYSINTITASEWSSLEQHGAVFLPSAGYRFGTSVKMVGGNGYYWSSIYVNATYAYGLYFQVSGLNSQDCSNRTYGRSVRLVQVVE